MAEGYPTHVSPYFHSKTIEVTHWTAQDSYGAQNLCAYETVALGYSPFYNLFTFDEWEGFAYSIDMIFSTVSGFHNPTGRAQGILWVEEFLSRLKGHVLQTTGTSANMTLSGNPITFPTEQNLYLGFLHDDGIVGVLTAFGFRQLAGPLPASRPPKCGHEFKMSKLVPFAARTDLEIIQAPQRVSPSRGSGGGEGSLCGGDRGEGVCAFLAESEGDSVE